MRILILGGDGYLGWPTAMRFSARGHEVVGRRQLHSAPLGRGRGLRLADPDRRPRAADRRLGGALRQGIRCFVGPIEDGDFLDGVVAEFLPEAVVHYGQQASAPYSMISRQTAVETQYANVIGNLNLLFAMRDHVPECHLVKLGTMGEYGQPNIDIEEGYIEIEHKGRKDTLPFPKLPGSLYHCSKVHDSTNIHFACRTWGLRATDLNQGVVYGIETEETARDERLITRFDYDEIFGTVLNRFCLQAVIGHPLTVYGEGNQTRGFLNIRDTLACVELAVANPADARRVPRLQPVHRAVLGDASWPSWSSAPARTSATRSRSSTTRTRGSRRKSTTTTRSTRSCSTSGSSRHLLGEELVESMLGTIERYKDRVDEGAIDPRTRWNPASSPPRRRKAAAARALGRW